MNEDFSYKEYVADTAFLSDYNAYQAKYAAQIRESDKVLLSLVGEALTGPRRPGKEPHLLDVGCSTGNLLLHLRRAFPSLALTGGDLAESSLAACAANEQLQGVTFRAMDVLKLPTDSRYDIITVNAVLYMMTDEEFHRALTSLASVLDENGTLIVFDFFHSFEQDLSIIEVSRTHPNGLRLRFRPMQQVVTALMAAGFSAPTFRPFTLPVDLPRHPDDGELISYTVRTDEGVRLPFRGTLFQPWCHLTAVKGG